MAYTPPQATNGPVLDTDAQAALIATRNALAQELAQEQVKIANGGGARASYSLKDGRQVDWNQWRAATIQQIKDLNELIAALDVPWEIAVHGWC